MKILLHPITKKISTSIIIFVMLFSFWAPPRQTHAFLGIGDITTDIQQFLKEFVLDTIIFSMASILTQSMVNKMVNWANGGFSGNPFYVEDYAAYFEDLGKDQGELFLQQLNTNPNPFARSAARVIQESRRGEGFRPEEYFTLARVIGPDWAEFQNDARIGGWIGMRQLTNPYNTPAGVLNQAIAELDDRVETKRGTVSLDLSSNNGFLSMERCVDPPGWTRTTTEDREVPNPFYTQSSFQTGLGSSGDFTLPSSRPIGLSQSNSGSNFFGGSSGPSFQGSNSIGVPGGSSTPQFQTSQATILIQEPVECRRYERQTPGTLIQGQIDAALKEPLKKISEQSEWGQLVSNVFSTLVSQFLSTGLKKLSDTVEEAVFNPGGPGGSGSPQNSGLAGSNTSGGATEPVDIERAGSWSTQSATLALVDLDTVEEVDIIDPVTGATTTIYETQLETAIRLTGDEVAVLTTSKELLLDFPEKAKKLDICIPGPDRGWQDRLLEKFNERMEKPRKEQGTGARGDQWEDLVDDREDDYRVNVETTKEQLIDAGGQTIPSAIVFLEEVEAVDNLSNDLILINSELRRKRRALGRLNILQTKYNDPSTPAEELTIIRQQYLDLAIDISNGVTIAQAQSRLRGYEFDIANIDEFQTLCETEVADRAVSDTDFRVHLNHIIGGPVTATQIGTMPLFCNVRNLGQGQFRLAQPGSEGISCSDFYRSDISDYTDDISLLGSG